MAYVRTVRTASGATAVQVVWSSRKGSRQIDHVGSAHDGDELAALKAIAAERIGAGQVKVDLGLAAAAGSGPLEIVGSKAAHLWEALSRAYDSLGFEAAAGGDEVFRALVLARIIEPTSKLDSLRVLAEAGIDPAPTRRSNVAFPAMPTPCSSSGSAGRPSHRDDMTMTSAAAKRGYGLCPPTQPVTLSRRCISHQSNACSSSRCSPSPTPARNLDRKVPTRAHCAAESWRL